MKKLFILFMTLMLAVNCLAALGPNKLYDDSGSFTLVYAGTSTQRDAVPSGVWTVAEGDLWWDTTGNVLYAYNGSSWAAFDGGGTTLDGAYNYGGDGSGRAIVCDDGALALSNTDADTAFLLTLNAAPGSSAALGGIELTVGTNSNEAALEIENSGDGYDIEGTAGWSFTKAGVIALTGGTLSAGDFLFDDTYDLSWDTSRDQLLFEDNAVLGIGGAHEAAGDVTFKWDATNLLVEAAADNTGQIRWGSTNAMDSAFYGSTNTNIILLDVSASTVESNGWTWVIQDDDNLNFGDSDEFAIEYDEDGTDNLLVVAANANDAVQVGDGTTNTDMKLMGATSGDFWLFDASADELVSTDCDLKLGQGSQIEFVDVTDGATDWTIDNATDETLLFTPTETTDDQTINFGNATNTTDFRLFGATASTVTFDASGDKVTFDAYDIAIGDGDIIEFGDSTDISIAFDGTGSDLDITGSGLEIAIGADDEGIDVYWHTETASDFVFFDETNAVVDFEDVSPTLMDDTTLVFGDGDDATIMYDETTDDNLEIAVASSGMSIVANDFITTTDGAAANQFKVDATGTVAGNAIVFETTNGGLQINADGSDNGDVTIDAADILTLTSADVKIFDGAAAETWTIEGTADAHEATIVFTDPTADITWTFPDGGTDTLAVMASTLATNYPEIANSVTGGTNQLIFEGATADGFETIVTPTDATADATLTLPDDSGAINYAPAGKTTSAADSLAIPITHAIVEKTTGADAEALTLANGENGQILVITLATDGGGTGTLAPTTTTGFSTIEFDDAGDTATLMYVDDTAGWVLMGCYGLTAQPTVAQ